MKTYIIYEKLPGGQQRFLDKNDNFVYNQDQAKKFDVRWIIEILKIIYKILILFGINKNIKYRKV